MENKLNRSVNPININVSYNNPVALNSFSNPDNDINKYQLDSGLSSSNKNGGGGGGGVCFSNNDSIQDSVNSTYYPAYLDNPLNKNVGGTHIDVRHKSNYEQDRMKQILTETNSPSPVMLGDPWSEWASI